MVDVQQKAISQHFNLKISFDDFNYCFNQPSLQDELKHTWELKMTTNLCFWVQQSRQHQSENITLELCRGCFIHAGSPPFLNFFPPNKYLGFFLNGGFINYFYGLSRPQQFASKAPFCDYYQLCCLQNNFFKLLPASVAANLVNFLQLDDNFQLFDFNFATSINTTFTCSKFVWLPTPKPI